MSAVPLLPGAAVNGRVPDFVTEHDSGRLAFAGRKYKQAKAVRAAGLPYVGVLTTTTAHVGLDPTVVAGAMFGDVSPRGGARR